ncbi:hypothetical protein [Streptomyces ipomoeae]|uniref:hypothetical protein n=1 Tax=Streptomyces ipomoeae TaxID=103232 RepID=UPI0011479A1B|nr:hypothetical protein [Streptomyces ipomoeae]MDX2938411.1 hypothetical protein [Streptomyces ipomoeae]TQE23772.1 hypothetical protein SipoB123_19680 [Streptomyces ipomoeae]
MQPQVAGREGKLPLRFKRPFQLWSYQVSHRRPVLRTNPGGGLHGTVEIEFLDVLGMKLKSQYPELLISVAPDTAATGIDEFVDIPDRHRARYTTLLVSDGPDDGRARGAVVVCESGELH